MLRLAYVLLCTVIFAPSSDAQEERINMMVLTKTAAFLHNSISRGVQAMWNLARENDWNITATEDASLFNSNFLRGFDEVVWLNTTGDVLNTEQQLAFRECYESGKGYVGIHAADTEHDWPWSVTFLSTRQQP